MVVLSTETEHIYCAKQTVLIQRSLRPTQHPDEVLQILDRARLALVILVCRPQTGKQEAQRPLGVTLSTLHAACGNLTQRVVPESSEAT